jgi:ABC-type Fe3+ transport system substrate-binding protein
MSAYKKNNELTKNLDTEKVNITPGPEGVPIKDQFYSLTFKGLKPEINKIRNPVKRMPYCIALLPPEIQDVFQKAFLKKFPGSAPEGNMPVFFKGNMEKSSVMGKYFSMVTNVDQLPDILITYDFNSFYFKKSIRNIFNPSNFDAFYNDYSYGIRSAGLVDPAGVFNAIGADAMVMVVDITRFTERQLPSEWYELLNPQLQRSIIMCGNKNYQHNFIFLNFIKTYGIQVLNHLKNNIYKIAPPEEIMDIIEDGNRGASVFVMPYSYARKINMPWQYSVIWPNDGAIAIPIQMFVKRNRTERYKEIIEFINSTEIGDILVEHGFYATNHKMESPLNSKKLTWIGWDFIYQNSLETLNKEIINKIEK